MSEQKHTSSQPKEFFQTVGQTLDSIGKDGSSKGAKDDGQITANEGAMQEIESLCMKCGKNGTTRLLLADIPYFRQVVVMSFECPHCGFKNSEIQPAAEIQIKGAIYRFKVETKEDLNREIIKSESAVIKVPDLELEIPAQRGQLTTVEGILAEVADDLELKQKERKKEYGVEIYDKIEKFIQKIREYIAGQHLPFMIELNDPAGNSWIEFKPGEAQHKWSKIEYTRTPEQNQALGLADTSGQPETTTQPPAAPPAATTTTTNTDAATTNDDTKAENVNDEVQSFPATCPSCLRPCVTHMKLVDIPHFKQVVLMSTVCDYCGYKSNEVTTGGAIPDHGTRTTLKITDPEDLARDILKSESCEMKIPELGLDMHAGTLGGRFTTIEGLIRQVHDELRSKVFTETSDSMTDEEKKKWTDFLQGLQDAADGKKKFTLILEDPLSSSYVQNAYAPDPDPNMTVEEFKRTKEQNDELGLSDMKV